jgi:preprotein translocase subunit YajC
LTQNTPFRARPRATNNETEEIMTGYRNHRWTTALTVLLTLALSTGLAWAQDDEGRGSGAVQTGDAPAAQPDGQQPPADPAADGQDGQQGQEDQAQDEGGQEEGGQGAQNQSPFSSTWVMLLMLGGIVVLYIIMGRGRRKQQQKRKEMLEQLKKGDKVVTIGGIEGTVMDVKNNEITVKVDETNNIRMKFARWAVQSVGEEPGEENPHQR